MFARPVDSEMVADRASWRTKCSLVMIDSADAGSAECCAPPCQQSQNCSSHRPTQSSRRKNVDHEPGLSMSVGGHRVVKGIGVLLDVEVLLNLAPSVGQEGPVGADGRAELAAL